MSLRMLGGVLPFKAGSAAYLIDAASPLPIRECNITAVNPAGVVVDVDGTKVLLRAEDALRRLLTESAYAVLAERLPVSETSAPAPAAAAGDLPTMPQVTFGGLVAISWGRARTRARVTYVPRMHQNYVFGWIHNSRRRSDRYEVRAPEAAGTGYVTIVVPQTMLHPVAAKYVPREELDRLEKVSGKKWSVS